MPTNSDDPQKNQPPSQITPARTLQKKVFKKPMTLNLAPMKHEAMKPVSLEVIQIKPANEAASTLEAAIAELEALEDRRRHEELTEAQDSLRMILTDCVVSASETFNKAMRSKIESQMAQGNKVGTGMFDANEVYPGLYVGGITAAMNVKALRENGITHILNVAQECTFAAEVLADQQTFSLKRLLLRDNPNQDIQPVFDETHEFIKAAREQNGKVLVHCFAGVSRSATIALAHMIRDQHEKLLAGTAESSINAAGSAGGDSGSIYSYCLDKAQQSRNKIQPNTGFTQALYEFHDALLEQRRATSQPRP